MPLINTNLINTKDLFILTTAYFTLFLSSLKLPSPLHYVRVPLSILTLLFLQGYAIVTYVVGIEHLGVEEVTYSIGLSVAIIVITGYILDSLRIPVPQGLFTTLSVALIYSSFSAKILRIYLRRMGFL